MWYAKRIGNAWAVAQHDNGGTLRATTKRKLLNLIMTNFLSVQDLQSAPVLITAGCDDTYTITGIVKIGPARYGVAFHRSYRDNGE